MKTTNYNLSESYYERWILSPLGLNNENSIVLWILLVFLGVAFGSLYYQNGEVAVMLGSIGVLCLFLLSIVRVDCSFYLLMAGVMLFEQYPIPYFSSITGGWGYFTNVKEISYLPNFEAGVFTPMEVHLVFILLGLFLRITTHKDFSFTQIPVFIPFVLFLGSVVFGVLYGLNTGGDFLAALWEVRALFYLFMMYLIVPQILDTKKQIKILMWIFICGITFKALQGVWRFIELGFTTGGFRVLTNHEDAVFIVTILIFFLGLLAYKINDKQRVWLLVFLIPLLLGFYVAQRRASYASFFVAFLAFIILLPAIKKINFLKYSLPVLATILIYCAIFWNSNASIARPIQMVKSGFEKPDISENVHHYYSNLYREFENYDLARTAVNNPVKGIGFGKKYDQPIPLVDIRFPLRDYIPHNQIIWILVKLGTIGFFCFWFFFNSFAAHGARVLNRLKDPYLSAVTIMIVVSVINQMVVSFFDLQLTYSRNMLYLGCLMGMLPVIDHLEREKNRNQKSETAETDE